MPDAPQEDILARLYFGKDDAESDIARGGLLRQGFLKTVAYEAAQEAKKSLFIGRKGSGKSAICVTIINSATPLRQSCLVTPDEISAEEIRRFELPGVAPAQAKALLWRYILNVKVAKFLTKQAEENDRNSASIKALRKFLIDNGELEDLRFQEKFWKIIERLKSSLSFEAFGAKLSIGGDGPSAGVRVNSDVDRFENNVIDAARELGADSDHPSLLILVDQLEKVWSNDPDSDAMVTGLLMAGKHVSSLYSNVWCVTFLRTDIYDLLTFADRDKFRGEEMRIDWHENALLDLISARAEASLDSHEGRDLLWTKIFPRTVAGEPTTSYLVSRTLMRPRDMIQLCNLCRDTSVKNGSSSIREADIREAVTQYSGWKLQDLQLEYRVNYPFLPDLYVMFQSSAYLVSREELTERFDSVRSTLVARYPEFENALTPVGIVDILFAIGFLGVLRDGKGTYSYSSPTALEGGNQDLVVHPGFREALRATSSIGLRPYEASLAVERIRAERTSLWNVGVAARGTRAFRLSRYLERILERLGAQLTASGLPAEVEAEFRANLGSALDDARSTTRVGTELEAYEVPRRVVRLLLDMQNGLTTRDALKGAAGKALVGEIERAIGEITRGPFSEEYFY